jgi:hypothetical protein
MTARRKPDAVREFQEILGTDALLFELAKTLDTMGNKPLARAMDRLRAQNAKRLLRVQAKAYPLLHSVSGKAGRSRETRARSDPS